VTSIKKKNIYILKQKDIYKKDTLNRRSAGVGIPRFANGAGWPPGGVGKAFPFLFLGRDGREAVPGRGYSFRIFPNTPKRFVGAERFFAAVCCLPPDQTEPGRGPPPPEQPNRTAAFFPRRRPDQKHQNKNGEYRDIGFSVLFPLALSVSLRIFGWVPAKNQRRTNERPSLG